MTIWFNAWQYEGSEQVWNGLADSIIEQVAARLDPNECVRFLLELHKRRYGLDRITRRVYDRISLYSTEKTRTWRWGSIMTFAASAVIAVIGRMDNSKLIPIVGLSGIIASVAVCIGTTALELFGKITTSALLAIAISL
jgi:hypothetical protein